MSRIPDAARQLVYARALGHCELHGGFDSRDGRWSVHHRKNRSQGGPDTPLNLLLLCGSGSTGCHGWVTEHPQLAADLGLTVWSWQTPAAEPLRTLDQVRWLTDTGTYTTEPPAEGAA